MKIAPLVLLLLALPSSSLATCQVQGRSHLNPWQFLSLKKDQSWASRSQAIKDWATQGNPTLKFDPKKKNPSLEELFGFISLTPFGASKLRYFAPLYQKGEVKIRFSSNIEIKCGQNAVACHLGREQEIWLNPNGELGSLASNLVHEIEHALDRRKIYQMYSDLKERVSEVVGYDELTVFRRFQAERQAFNAKNQFEQELKESSSCAFLYQKEAERERRYSWASDSDLMSMYFQSQEQRDFLLRTGIVDTTIENVMGDEVVREELNSTPLRLKAKQVR